jgi:purine-binding chemotaxis protein CheW
MIASRQLCTFFLDGHLFGVDAQTVQEVIRYQEMTRVPKSSPSVSGLINLRGQIVTAIDLRSRLGMQPREVGKLPMNVVVRSDDGAVSLLVDQIGDVIEVDAENFETPPDTLQGPTRELVKGAYKLDGRLLLLLDCDTAVQLSAV